jgi:DNA-binding response OmpR family regulator
MPTILVVDDDPDLRDEIALVLSHAGYDVVAVGDGGEALDWLHREPARPAVILLDWMMPIVDGLAFLTGHASDPRSVGVPVIVITAFSDTADIPHLCVDHVLQKPFHAADLVGLLARLCRHTAIEPSRPDRV